MEDNKSYFGEIGDGLKTGWQLQVYGLHIV